MIHTCRILVGSTESEELGIDAPNEWCKCEFSLEDVVYWFYRDYTIVSLISGDTITINTKFKDFAKTMKENEIKFVIEAKE